MKNEQETGGGELTAELKLKLLVPDRPWEAEPNSKEWIDKRSGYRCRVWRHPELMHLNGYVSIPKEHFFYDSTYDEISGHTEVHGGLTYSGHRDGCYWVGFDCGHAGDLSPGILKSLLTLPNGKRFIDRHQLDDTYRTFEYVESQTKRLAWQLKRLEMRQL